MRPTRRVTFLRNGQVRPADEQYQTLLAVSEAIVSHRDLHALIHDLAGLLHLVVRFEYLILGLHDPATNQMLPHVLESTEPLPSRMNMPTSMPVDGCPMGRVWRSQEPLILPMAEHFVPSVCILPLTTARQRLGVLGWGCKQADVYSPADVAFLQQVAKQVAVAVENALAFDQIASLKEQLEKEKVYLEEEICTANNFEDIVGASAALQKVLKEVETVAPTDATVLIRGETGTGKELIARALHQLSPRRERTLIKLNCAAIPTGLLESELFGHEKGAFTGAVAQKVGRFELAHGGTLFLDEVGDITLELQPKLLRVLQEQEFERLGGTRTIKGNARMVAATHRDLERMVAEGQFRRDLYYRLNVFPVELPPLRERPADIPELVRHFTRRFSCRMGRRVETIPAETMAALVRYSWPGNVRELENFIERAVILSPGTTLRVPLGELNRSTASLKERPVAITTLKEVEFGHFLSALRDSNWVVGGPNGAAARLGLTRSTFYRMMKRLGISRSS
jgi:formate hydrogenlyase transcriptional activator